MPIRDIRRHGYRGLRGYYPSQKAGRSVAFESRLERDHLLLLDADPQVLTFDEQPVTIHFAGRTRARTYTPDARVIYRAAPTTLVEVKYTEDLASLAPEVRASVAEAHDAARAWCAARGWRFELRTDREILGPALDRAHALRAFARAPVGVVTPDAVAAFVAAHPGVALAELALVLGHITRRVVLHLVWRGLLRDEPFAVPTDATRLYPAEHAP